MRESAEGYRQQAKRYEAKGDASTAQILREGAADLDQVADRHEEWLARNN